MHPRSVLLSVIYYIIIWSGECGVCAICVLTFLGASYSVVNIMLQDMFEEYDMIFLFWAHW